MSALRDAFDAMDIDHSGALSVDEFKQILARPGGGPGGGSSQLSDEEIEAIIAELYAPPFVDRSTRTH